MCEQSEIQKRFILKQPFRLASISFYGTVHFSVSAVFFWFFFFWFIFLADLNSGNSSTERSKFKKKKKNHFKEVHPPDILWPFTPNWTPNNSFSCLTKAASQQTMTRESQLQAARRINQNTDLKKLVHFQGTGRDFRTRG